MSMWRKIREIGNFFCPKSDRLSHRNQVVSASVHGSNLGVQSMGCDACLEENKACKCDNVLHHAEANSSFAHSVINMIGMLIGLGQLSTPYALEQGGWASAFFFIGLGVVCAYSSHLLGKCLEKNPKLRSYADIGENAFGNKGRILASTFIYLEIFTALVSYTISLHDNITKVFTGIRVRLPWAKFPKSQLLTTTAVVVALPSLWVRDLSSISFLSSGGILMSLVIFTSVAGTAIFGGIKANHSIPVLQVGNIPAISGLYIYSYAGHVVFPNLYKSMKDPSQFTKVSIVSFASATALYTALAFMGAKLFGPDVRSQITLSMPPHLILTKIALWATVLTPMTKYALEFTPFAIQLEHKLPASLSPRSKMIVRGTVGSILLLLILVLALSVPYFEDVLSFAGSLVSISICVILPCAFYTKISWAQMSKPSVLLNMTLIAFGSVLGVIGTVSSSKLLIRNLRTGHKA